MTEVGLRKALEEVETVADAIQVDVGNASGGTLGDLYSILGNPAVALYSHIGNFQGRTNDKSLLDILGLPDVANGSLYERLGAFTSGLTVRDVLLRDYVTFYEFNDNTANNEDTDYWTFGGAVNKSIAVNVTASDPASKKLITSLGGAGAQNDDAYIHGDGKYANNMTPNSANYSTVTFETRVKFASTADCQCLFGLDLAGGMTTTYAEPAQDSALFIIDDGVSANYVCRSYNAAEEETASDVALDTSWHKFTIEWTTTSVVFKIDDVTKATHSTQVPDSPLGMIFLIRTQEVAGAEKSITREYVHCWGE